MGIIGKVEQALGMDKSGSGGSQGTGDRRTDSMNDYNSTTRSGASNLSTDRAQQQNIGSNTEYGAGMGTEERHHGGMREGTRMGNEAGLGAGMGSGMAGTSDMPLQTGMASSGNEGMMSSTGRNVDTTGMAPSISYPAGEAPPAHIAEAHHHHTGTGAVGGAILGHEAGHHAGAGAIAGGLAGHEYGEEGNRSGRTREGMVHKAERAVGEAPEQRAARDNY